MTNSKAAVAVSEFIGFMHRVEYCELHFIDECFHYIQIVWARILVAVFNILLTWPCIRCAADVLSFLFIFIYYIDSAFISHTHLKTKMIILLLLLCNNDDDCFEWAKIALIGMRFLLLHLQESKSKWRNLCDVWIVCRIAYRCRNICNCDVSIVALCVRLNGFGRFEPILLLPGQQPSQRSEHHHTRKEKKNIE